MERRNLQLGKLVDYQNGLWSGKNGALTRAKVIRVTEMKDNGTYDLSTAKELQVEAKKLMTRKVVQNSILLERSGGGENKPVGRVIIFGEDVLKDVYSFSNFTTLLLPKADIVFPKYIFYSLYFFHLSGKTKQLQKAVTGIRNLEFKKYLEQEISVPFKDGKPDLAEQKRIADKLDRVSNEIEKGHSKAVEVGNQTAAFGKSLLHKTFTNPELQRVKLGDYFDLYQPRTITTKDLIPNGAYLVYGANGVIGRYDKYNHENSEVLMTCRGATCGEINITEPKSWINGNAMVITPKTPDLDKKFIAYALRSISKTQIISGAAQPQITRKTLAPLEVSIPFKDGKPDLAEQKSITDELDKAFVLSEQLRTLFVKQEKSFVGLRASVLGDAFKTETQTVPVAVPIPATAPRMFDIQQAVALILKRFERGEMVVAKMLYLAQSIYQVPLGIQFSAQNFGPYDSAVKKAVTAGLSPRNKFFAKKGSGNTRVLSLGPNANKILKYANSSLTRKMNSYLDATMSYFSNRDSNSIERLATICKIIEDTKTTDEKAIRDRLHEWKPNRFQDTEVSRTIAFIKQQKWDTKLIT